MSTDTTNSQLSFRHFLSNHVPCAQPKMFRNLYTDVSYTHAVATSVQNVGLKVPETVENTCS
jgi:hypothetical protein